MKQFRCSSLSKLMGEKAEITDTAKSYIREVLKEDLFGFHSFTGNKHTQKGVLLEDEAIRLSGQMRYRNYQKHSGRMTNDFITGECDILDVERKLIIDTKCSWDIGTHPFFEDEAKAKVKKAGYDWQMQGYMWLYDCEVAEIDFWLLPCPPELLNDWDDIDSLVHKVQAIDLRQRLTTVKIERNENMIDKIKRKIQVCQQYYQALKDEFCNE